MAKKLPTSIPRIALTPAEAAASIGVGPDFFDANVAPELRLVRRGRKRLVPISELEGWVTDSAGAPVVQDIDHRLTGGAPMSSPRRATVAGKMIGRRGDG